jgi:hypothetical protein
VAAAGTSAWSRTFTTNLLSYNSPVITDILVNGSSASVPTNGGTRVILVGTGFGPSRASAASPLLRDIASVSYGSSVGGVGAYACTGAYVSSNFYTVGTALFDAISCTLQAGAGRSLYFRVSIGKSVRLREVAGVRLTKELSRQVLRPRPRTRASRPATSCSQLSRTPFRGSPS